MQVWTRIGAAARRMLGDHQAATLLAGIASLPVRRSHATRTLGSYVSRAGHAVCIRLQFALEPALLEETFLHELAHACDHLSNQPGRPYRRVHGGGWQAWAAALGIEGKVRGQSEVLTQLYREKLKPVAVCRRCGVKFQRLRRLSRRRNYLHQACGGQLDLL
ncbi:MAG TPA: SprT-like domain-containing protein [Geopsychrobacteraceae bacterium]